MMKAQSPVGVARLAWVRVLVTALEIAILAVYFVTLTALATIRVHRYVLAWRYLRGRRRLPAMSPPADLPRVTVQLPLYNERYVAERLLDAVAAIDYPRELLEVQVLDDSDDDTSEIVARVAQRHRAARLDIQHLRRGSRDGYKAGALAYGLARATGDLVAVFDADFIPPPEFLQRVVSHFEDPAVGMVQARWGHINRDSSVFTSTQALMLDGHFLIEHTARASAGYFFNFNGTAGVWRRTCIESAGGWHADTLTEDLDLSYRAQLAGWRFVYLPQVVVPGEVPAEMNAFKSQQRRWAKGAIQTARKLLPRLLRAPLPARLKLEALFHLTASLSYLLMALLTLLFPIAMVIRHEHGVWLALLAEVPVLLLGTASVSAFYLITQREEGRLRIREILFLMALGVGVSVSNARAVLEALFSRQTPFERTPKSGVRARSDDWRARRYRARRDWLHGVELLFGLYVTAALAYAVASGVWVSTPFLALFAVGYLYVGAMSVWQGRSAARPG